ncbi:MAG TPA: hypothetical protein VHL14_03520 [Steroidobacteraceae bacterium]|jgi:uncharacterized protein involved in copper resistance|nr:hypothetical protein [Steroidobacteraceae bacterium]
MRRRHFKFWLVILNLLAFNAYALNAVAALQPHHAQSQMVQVAVHHGMTHQGMGHKGCHEAQQPSVGHQHSDNCDMPCCKDVNSKITTQSDHCGCKLGSSTLQLYAVMADCHDAVIDHHGVDAMSTAFVLQDRTQRLLRPPILTPH